MMMEIFSVLDMAAKQYLEPFFAPTIDFAIRGFKSACQKDGHQFAEYPEDYVLYKIGVFDGEKGEITGESMQKIANATSFTGGFGNQGDLQLQEEAS